MAYILYNNDGTVLVTLADGEVDSVSTSLDLIGKNYNNYGQYFNQNLVRLLNSFADTAGNEPRSPQVGQLWFNKTTKRLTVYDGDSFKPTYGATVSGTEPVTTSTGDLWYDTVHSQMKLWDGSSYKLIAPQVDGRLGKFGVEPPPEIIEDYATGNPTKIGFLYTHGKAVALLTTSSFTFSDTDAGLYIDRPFETAIVNGVTVLGNLDLFNGDLHIQGQRQVPPAKTLTAFADITWFGDPTGADLAPLTTATLATVYNRIQSANVHIKEKILNVMFNTSTYYSSLPHPYFSEAKVVCYFNTQTSVRHYSIVNYSTATNGQFPDWKPYEVYPTSFTTTWGSTSTNTNIILVPV